MSQRIQFLFVKFYSARNRSLFFTRLAFGLTLSILRQVILPAQPQQVYFQHIGYEQGLTQGQVTDILEDSHGFIWLNTSYGVKRYDGYEFVEWQIKQPDGALLLSPRVSQMMEDKNGDIWFGTKSGIYVWHRRTGKYSTYFPDISALRNNNNIVSLFQDSKERIWVGALNGLFEFLSDEEKFVQVREENFQQVFNPITIAEDKHGNLLVGCAQGLLKIDPNKHTARRSLPINGNGYPGNWVVYSVFCDSKSIWVAAHDGLWLWEAEKDFFSIMPLPSELNRFSIAKVKGDAFGNLWMAMNNSHGLLRMEISSGKFQHFTYSQSNRFGISNNRLSDLEIDKFGYLWIGTYSGVDKLYLKKRRFELFQNEPGENNPANLIFKTYFDSQGGFYFNTYDSRLFYSPIFGTPAKDIMKINVKEFANFQINGFHKDAQNRLWMGHSAYGAYLLEPNTSIPIHFEKGLVKTPCWFFAEDDNDPRFLWMGSGDGLWKVNAKTFERQNCQPKDDLPQLPNNKIWSAIQCPDQSIWAITGDYNNGLLLRFDKTIDYFQLIDIQAALPTHQKGIQVRQMACIGDTIYLATTEGLGKIALRPRTFSLSGVAKGLPEQQLMGLVADLQGNVWMKGLRHIIKYQPKNGAIQSFLVGKDMQEFNSVGAAVSKGGLVVFHGINGFYAFYPDEVRPDASKAKLVLTDFKVLNKSRDFGKAIELVDTIILNPTDNIFSFEYAYLHTVASENNRYRYILQGFDRDWVEANHERKATYTNLNPGWYTFKVVAANPDGTWLEEKKGITVLLRVLPPWYRTWWAMSLGALLFVGAVFWLYRFKVNRKLAAAETRRLRDLDAVKTRLYTNITHEFRTPLTIILGEAEQGKMEIEKSEIVKLAASPISQFLISNFNAIRRNGQQLLTLVNQMLDLAKLESGNLPLKMAQGDMMAFLKYLLESFHSLADAKKIRLHFDAPVEAFFMDYDEEKLRQIVSNLLSNAIKFTPEGGEIRLAANHLSESSKLSERLADGIFQIQVTDSGAGIPPAQLDHIFERFYQVDDSATRHAEGTGIGLTLTKELVKLLGGTIAVKSKVGKGSEFTVTLPFSRRADFAGATLAVAHVPSSAHASALTSTSAPLPAAETLPVGWGNGNGHGIEEHVPAQGRPQGSPLLLLIEDNEDVRRYIIGILSKTYRLETAPDGKAGLEKAFDLIPDLILSDVMMPEMDGYEVCRALKNDLRTSHIPVVMLTAKADFESRLEGLEQGAEAYLAKPFEQRELELVLRKLLENREKLRRYFTSAEFIAGASAVSPAPPVEGKTEAQVRPQEEAFLKKTLQMVEDHLDDTELSAERLAALLHLSYEGLYGKIKPMTGMGITEYVRHVRLHRAAQLLIDKPEWTVARIALEVGFNNFNYFSREFKKLFGRSPSEHRNRGGG